MMRSKKSIWLVLEMLCSSRFIKRTKQTSKRNCQFESAACSLADRKFLIEIQF